MSLRDCPLSTFLKELMRKRGQLPAQLARDLNLSHSTVSRWLSGQDIPSPRSCRQLAKYAGVPVERVLVLAGHLPPPTDETSESWPDFRQYAKKKYPDELDDDLITMIETLIERRRGRSGEDL